MAPLLPGRILGFPKVVKMYSRENGPRRVDRLAAGDIVLMRYLYLSRSLSALIPRLYPYFRHTIGPVRLAVVRTIQAFLDDADLPDDWINADILHLLYKNLVVEDRMDCRTESLAAWKTALRVISVRPDFLSNDVLPHVAGWLNIALVPINMPLEGHLFHDVTARGSNTAHNIDKSILGADLALVSPDTILRNRIDAIIALAEVTRYDVSAVSLVPATQSTRRPLAELLHSVGHSSNAPKRIPHVDQRSSTVFVRNSHGRMDPRSR